MLAENLWNFGAEFGRQRKGISLDEGTKSRYPILHQTITTALSHSLLIPLACDRNVLTRINFYGS